MKYIRFMMISFLGMIVLAACGKDEEMTETYKGVYNGHDTTMEITAIGDKVSKETLTQVVTGTASKEEAEAIEKELKGYYKEMYKDVPEGAVESEITVNEDNTITVVQTINYADEYLDALVEANVLESNGEKITSVSKEKTVNFYEEMGFEKVEE